MPNYAWNTLYIKKGDFDKFVKGADEKQLVDFNVLVPEPEEITNTTSGTDTDMALLYFASERLRMTNEQTLHHLGFPKYKAFTLDRLRKHDPEKTDEEKDALYKQGEALYNLICKYGAHDWYTWRNDYWGTKWNAWDCEKEYGFCDFDANNQLVESGPDEDCCIRFTTAWGAPENWLLELARNCDFRLDCEVEGFDDRYRYIGEDQKLHILKTEFTEVDVWE